MVAAGTHPALLNRRDDFPKHFIISAGLAAKAGGPCPTPSVFTRKSKIPAAAVAFPSTILPPTASARARQRRLRAGIGEKDIMPMTDDLPEFMPEPEFKRRFGGVDAPPYKNMMAQIEQRIAGLPFYRLDCSLPLGLIWLDKSSRDYR